MRDLSLRPSGITGTALGGAAAAASIVGPVLSAGPSDDPGLIAGDESAAGAAYGDATAMLSIPEVSGASAGDDAGSTPPTVPTCDDAQHTKNCSITLKLCPITRGSIRCSHDGSNIYT